MKTFKKVGSILFVVLMLTAMVFSLTACSANKEEDYQRMQQDYGFICAEEQALCDHLTSAGVEGIVEAHRYTSPDNSHDFVIVVYFENIKQSIFSIKTISKSVINYLLQTEKRSIYVLIGFKGNAVWIATEGMEDYYLGKVKPTV